MAVKNETRVATIQFDNKDFEKNVQQSLDTLSRLNKALEFKDGTKGLDNISDAASRVNMAPLNDSVQEVSTHFSKLQIIGTTALANITNAAVNAGRKLVGSFIQPLTQGGLQRAMNMEQAKFMFEGMDVAAGKVGEAGTVMDNIYQSVKGTIYSLDKAALLASQLMASGITATGEDAPITHVLKAVAGVASMYNADYERVGEIFATVKAQGVLMGHQVDSLRIMGLPVYRKLADYLNEANNTKEYTEAKVKDMISKQEIDFDTFSKAMEDAFGDQAARSKETFIGALEDMKAAAARIGESFYAPILKSGRDFFNATVPVLDAIKSRLTNEDLTGPIDKFGAIFDTMVQKVIVGMDLLAAAINFDSTKEELEELVKSGLADKSRLANLEKYSSIIEGIRAALGRLKTVLEFFKSVIMAVWNIGAKILTAARPIGELFLTIGSGVGSLIDKLGTAIKYINNFSSSAGRVIDSLAKAIEDSDILSKASDKITAFFAGLANVTGDLGRSMEVLAGHLNRVVYTLIDGLFNALQRIKEGFGELISLSDAVSTAVGMVMASKFAQLTSVFTLGKKNGFSFLNVLEKLGLQGLKTAKLMSGALSEALWELNKTMEVYQRSLDADVLLKIGLAIGTLALSIKILSTIDAGALMQSVSALGVLAVILKKTLGGMLGMLGSIGKFKLKDMLALFVMQTALIRIGLALVSMATAVKILASLDFKSAVQGVTALWLLSKILVKVMLELSKIPKLNNLTINLSFIAMAITMLALAMKIIATMSWKEALVGASGIIVLAQVLAATMKHIAQIEKASKGVNPLSLLAVALAIDMMALAFYALSKISWEGMGPAVVSMIVLVGSLVVLMDAMNKLSGKGDPMKNAGAILVTSIAIKMLAKSFASLGNMEWEQIGKASVGIGALFTFIAFMMDVMSGIKTPEDMITKMGSLIAIAVSLKMMAGVFEQLGNMNFEQIGQAATGLFVIGLFLTAMMGLSKIVGKGGGGKDMLALAGSMIAFGIALQVFALGMAALGALPIETIAVAMVAFVASVMALSYLSEAVEGSLTAMLKLAGTIAIFGLSLGVVAASMLLMAFALSTLSESLMAITGGVAVKFAAMVGILALLSPLLKTAGIGMAIFGVGMAAIGLGMIAVGGGLAAIGLGLKLVTTSMDQVVASINSFSNVDWTAVGNLAALITIFGLLSPLAAALGVALMAVGTGLLAIAGGIAGIAEGFALIRKAISTIFSTIDTKITAICEKASDKLTLFKDTIKTFSKVIKALLDALKTMIKGVNDLKDSAYKSGKNVVDGLVKGINDNKSRAVNAAKNLAKATLAAYKKEMGISSPAKAMVEQGFYTVMGVVKAIEDNTNLGVNAMTKFASAVLGAYDYIEQDDIQPVISPVLDLTNVKAGMNTIPDMMNPSMGISAPVLGINKASIVSAGFNDPNNRSNFGDSVHDLTKKLDSMMSVMNSRTLNNYISIEGSSDPEGFADDLIRSFRLNARTV